MIVGIQIVGVLFGLLMLYFTFLEQKRKVFTVKEYIFWLGLWAAFMFITFFPNSLNFIIKDILDLKRPIDFYIIVGFMVLTGMMFHMYMVMRKTQNKVEEIVRKMALEKRR
jgi:hypothetical protein